LKRIDEGSILRGLWLPPFASLAEEEAPDGFAKSLVPFPVQSEPRILDPVSHSITHRRISVYPVVLEFNEAPNLDENWEWEHPESVSLPTSSLLQKLAVAVTRRRL
jgi:adenine-specific DNA glycosylase